MACPKKEEGRARTRKSGVGDESVVSCSLGYVFRHGFDRLGLIGNLFFK